MKIRLLVILSSCLALACSRTTEPVLENDYVRFEFSKENGALISMYNVKDNVEHIDSAKAADLSLWNLEYMPGYSPAESLPTSVSFRKKGKDCLEIAWRQENGVAGPEFKAVIRLKKDRPSLAEWYFQADGIEGLGIKSVHFPRINAIRPQGEKDALAVGSWTGTLIENPWSYATEEKPLFISNVTAVQSIQVSTLYNPEGSGIYYGTEDPDAWHKDYCFKADPDAAQFYISHALRIDVDSASYMTPYPTVAGTFKGDWIDASKLYKEWALKQSWCAESRLKQGLVPEWVLNTAVWVWNRGRSGNVLGEALDFQNRTGVPVSVLWHWWHSCSYDVGFPEYLPPREGRMEFTQAVAAAREEGIHCLPYMNSHQWGDSTESWKEQEAGKWATRTCDGGTYAKIYNVFEGKSITPMCLGSEFWHKTYSDLCDSLINTYGTGGVYMDQACQSKACYNVEHGHSVGGGNVWIKGHLNMIDRIRKVTDGRSPVLAGEGCSEYWMGHLDLGLTLEAAHNRLKDGLYDRIPFFHSVYHGYQITFGNVSMLVSPPYEESWPEKYRPADAETIQPDDFDRQFMMEQARNFVWGIQPCIANYHGYLFEKKPDAMGFLMDMIKTRYQALDFMLYGDFERCPEMPGFKEEITICKQRSYLTSGNRISVSSCIADTFYKSAWKSPDGRLGIALANIVDQPRDIEFTIDPSQYDIPAKGSISVISADRQPYLLQEYNGVTSVKLQVPARSTMILSFRE